jgi:hypothetical protein
MKAVQTTRCDSEQHRARGALATRAVVRQLSTDPKRGLDAAEERVGGGWV